VRYVHLLLVNHLSIFMIPCIELWMDLTDSFDSPRDHEADPVAVERTFLYHHTFFFNCILLTILFRSTITRFSQRGHRKKKEKSMVIF
jgi:hypothetical protein